MVTLLGVADAQPYVGGSCWEAVDTFPVVEESHDKDDEPRNVVQT